MKKFIIIFLGVVSSFFFASIVIAAPSLIYQRTLLPEADNTYDLGTSTLRWRNIYGAGTISGMSLPASSVTGTPTHVGFFNSNGQLTGDDFFTYNSSTRRLRLGYGSGFSTLSIVATSTSGLTVGENSSVNLLPTSNNSDSVGGVLYTAGNTGATAGITMSPPTYVGGLFTGSNNANVNLNATRGSGLLGRFTFGDGRTNFATGLWGEISNTGGYATSSAAIYAGPGIFTAGNVTTSYSILSDPQITGITKWNLAVNGGDSFINDKLVVGVSSTKAAVLAVVASSSTALPFLILDSSGVTSSQFYADSLTVGKSASNSQGVFNISNLDPWFGTISASGSIFINNGSSAPASVGNTVPMSGAGTRLIWIPDKAAFRAGYVNGTQWDETSIGAYSFGLGQNNTAGGISAMSFGNGNTVNGDNAVGIGRSNSLNSTSADDSVGIGRSNSVSTADSVAIGLSNTIGTSDQGYALGWANNVSGNLAFGIGDQNFVSVIDGYAFGRANVVDTGGYAMALGYSNTVSGAGTTANWAIGTSNGVTGADAYAIGKGNTASNTGAAAIGDSNTASGQYATTIGGRNLTVSGNYSMGINLDDTTRTVARNNTMAVMGGNVGIKTVFPSSTLHVFGSISEAYNAITATTTLDDTYSFVTASSTMNQVDIYLPSATTTLGRVYTVKRINSGGQSITVIPSGGNTIDGATTLSIPLQYQSYSIISDGVSQWFIK